MCSLMLCITAAAQRYTPFDVVDTTADKILVERLLKESGNLAEGENFALFFARKFIGRPYVANTLEVADPECLVVDTRRFDCTTLVEVVTALTICAQNNDSRYEGFLDVLMSLRYGGFLYDYTSRIHYFSAWIVENDIRGWVKDIQSPNPPFKAVQTLDLWYMSRNADKYVMLRRHPEFVSEIRSQEEGYKGRKFRYIPKASVVDSPLMRKTVLDGDIIAITTSKPGLDIAHVGFAVWKKDGLHLLNASLTHKKVVEEQLTLGEYLKRHKSFTGIRVVRIRNVEKLEMRIEN